MSLSKRAIDALAPSSILWDAKITGFGCRSLPSGKRVYVLKYRHLGRQRWYTIGTHGAPWTPETAAREAKRLLGTIAGNKDPAEHRDWGKTQRNVNEVWDEFVDLHVTPKLKPKTAYNYQRWMTRFALPAVGVMRIDAVTERDVQRLHHQMRGTPRQANAMLEVLSKLFAWCEGRGYRSRGSNPCSEIERFPENKRERFLTDEELGRLGAALLTATADGTSLHIIAAIRLLLFTGARLSEILTLRWDQVDERHQCLRLPTSKTGAKDILLNPPALEVLATLPRIKGNPYVICGSVPGAHLVNLEKPWRRVRALANLDDVRIHDLRHSFASVAVSHGHSLPVIGGLLGHSQPQTTARYAHLAAHPVRAAGTTVANHIDAAMRSASGAVGPLRRSV